MKKIELFILPLSNESDAKTRLVVDETNINSKDNRLTNLVVAQPMRKWLNPYKKKLFVWKGFLAEIIEEFNDKAIKLVFHGCRADFNVFRKSIVLQQTKFNRNGDSAEVEFEFIDEENASEGIKVLTEALNDMYEEADNWGEDDTMKAIDLLKKEVTFCSVCIERKYISTDEFERTLTDRKIGVGDSSLLTLIPVDASVPATDMEEFIKGLIADSNSYNEYVIVNLAKDSDSFIDTVFPFDEGYDMSIKYIDTVDEAGIDEIEKLYGMTALLYGADEAKKILSTYPDCDTNTWLLDIRDRLDDLPKAKLY